MKVLLWKEESIRNLGHSELIGGDQLAKVILPNWENKGNLINLGMRERVLSGGKIKEDKGDWSKINFDFLYLHGITSLSGKEGNGCSSSSSYYVLFSLLLGLQIKARISIQSTIVQPSMSLVRLCKLNIYFTMTF